MEDEQLFSFNFWPAFADLMLSLILILLLIIGYTYFSSIDVRSIQVEQKNIAEALHTGERSSKLLEGGAEISDRSGRLLYRLAVDPHDPMLQTISFSDSMLFNPDDFHLKPSGKAALKDVGGVVRTRLGWISEIQIRGHADVDRTMKYQDNLELASLRANEVFRFLTTSLQIDPSRNLISASSFGEFSPVQRKRDEQFDERKLVRSNQNEVMKQANRRIEMVLFFRRPQSATPGSRPLPRR